MRTLVLLVVNVLYGYLAVGSDTIPEKRTQIGILFISNHNYRYNKQSEGNVITERSFPDIFFPTKNATSKNAIKCLVGQTLENGIITSYFSQREALKRKALIIRCQDTSNCYGFDTAYVVPVQVTYKIYRNKTIPPCGKFVLSLSINGEATELRCLKNDNSIIEIKALKK